MPAVLCNSCLLSGQPDTTLISYEYAVKVMNRFKELDLVNSVPEDLWRGDCNIVQEAANTTIPEKSKKVMWLSEEALQTAKEKREPKKKKAREKGKDISN